jgi:hypothetical protein
VTNQPPPDQPEYGFGLLPLDDRPPSGRPPGWKTFGAVTAAVLALCCGGLLGLGLLVDEPGTNRAAATASEEARNPEPAAPAVRRATTAPTSPPARSVAPTRTGTPRPARTATTPAPARTTVKPKPATKPATKAPATVPTRQGVTPGAFCSPEGAFGIGRKNGRLYQCRSVDGDQARWKRV